MLRADAPALSEQLAKLCGDRILIGCPEPGGDEAVRTDQHEAALGAQKCGQPAVEVNDAPGIPPGASVAKHDRHLPGTDPLPERVSETVEWIVAGWVNREEGKAWAEDVVERDFAAITKEDVRLRQHPADRWHAPVRDEEAALAGLLGTEPHLGEVAARARPAIGRGEQDVPDRPAEGVGRHHDSTQPDRQPNDRLRVGPPLRLVGLEERRACACAQYHHQLPGEVIGIADAGVKPGPRERGIMWAASPSRKQRPARQRSASNA